MPELPEVETVMRGLDPVMRDSVIASVDVNRPDLRWPFPVDMKQRLDGARVVGLRRRSKYVLIDLDRGETLIVHLGMSGRMLVTGAMIGGFHHSHVAPEKHDHVVFHMQDGARVTFNDPRRFGAMDMVATDQLEQHKFFAKLGPEPLSNSFDAAYLYDSLKGRKSPIKSALLDQRIVAGLGNIYVCEVLFRTGISPLRKAGTLKKQQTEALVPAIRQVLEDAILAGGSSLKDFRRADGELGYFQHRFNVYDQEGAPCPTPECSGEVKRVIQSGRSSFYCPICQR